MGVSDRTTSSLAGRGVRVLGHLRDAIRVRPVVVAEAQRCLDARDRRRSKLPEPGDEALCTAPEVRTVDRRACDIRRCRPVIGYRAILPANGAEIGTDLDAGYHSGHVARR